MSCGSIFVYMNVEVVKGAKGSIFSGRGDPRPIFSGRGVELYKNLRRPEKSETSEKLTWRGERSVERDPLFPVFLCSVQEPVSRIALKVRPQNV